MTGVEAQCISKKHRHIIVHKWLGLAILSKCKLILASSWERGQKITGNLFCSVVTWMWM